MFYEIKFLCNNDIYTVTLTLFEDLYKKMDTAEIDSMLTSCIESEKMEHNVSEYPHSITSMRKTANGTDWTEMI